MVYDIAQWSLGQSLLFENGRTTEAVQQLHKVFVVFSFVALRSSSFHFLYARIFYLSLGRIVFYINTCRLKECWIMYFSLRMYGEYML